MTDTTGTTAYAQLDQRLAELAGTWTLDPSHTSMELSVRHMMVATVRGRVRPESGTLHLATDDPGRSSVEVEIDAASIDTGNPDRDAHLRSPDFLDVERYPTMRFRSTEVDDRGDGTFVLRGELTVKDVTKTVSLDCEVGGVVRDPYGNDRVGFSASGAIDRTAFGLRWNAALEGGGVVVGDKVSLALDAEFVKPAA
ncbi:MAG TPA: YceI family protein [Acidimicrobiales bacterium]|jgi:polyisoprenoid-binding protein YceI|nr:YceI family protein [Acidimicrobiales bacterium]